MINKKEKISSLISTLEIELELIPQAFKTWRKEKADRIKELKELKLQIK